MIDFFCLREALLPKGFADNVKLTVTDGTTVSVESEVKPAGDSDRFAGTALPGMPNLHTHAFQRDMASCQSGVARRRIPFGPGAR